MLTPEIAEKVIHEELVQYAEQLSDLYAGTHDAKCRKAKGQFFTPRQVSIYMASLFDITDNRIRLLDAGAGTGILMAAFCDRLLSCDKAVQLTVDAYENDRAILPLLEKTLEACKVKLESKGHSLAYSIHDEDFILSNEQYLREPDMFRPGNLCLYDFIVSNPPYYKLNKCSPQSGVMAALVSGQPNIYTCFMALSASMLKPEGEMVFITPRSFCSGLYYKRFREWLLNNAEITNIHLFESRADVFDKDEVLQENVIIKARKRKETGDHSINITVSENKSFRGSVGLEVCSDDIIHRSSGENFIRIPTSLSDVSILHIVDKWSCTLRSLGLEISTGPVVPFRAEDYLMGEPTDSLEWVPLLWMHNLWEFGVVWPLRKSKKASAIRVCIETAPLLIPVKNYVMVKRFTSKEQKRRLQAAILLQSEFPYQSVGIENHVNYIYRPRGNLSVYEAFGIAALLNTRIIDRYFRALNGNTQVNATDIRSLPLPNIEDIKTIGEAVYESKTRRGGFTLEQIVNGILGIKVQE